MHIIAITGKCYSGKDTMADYLVKNYGYIKLAFADPLKELCKSLFNFTDNQLYNNKEIIDSYWGISPRKAMQTIGTDLLRNELSKIFPHIDKNIFVMNMEKRIKDLYNNNNNVKIVISDLRFYNEYLMLKNLKEGMKEGMKNLKEGMKDLKEGMKDHIYFININRNDEIINHTFCIENDIFKYSNHSSENDISKYDIKYDKYINNNNTVLELYNNIDNIMTSLNIMNMHKEFIIHNDINYYHIML